MMSTTASQPKPAAAPAPAPGTVLISPPNGNNKQVQGMLSTAVTATSAPKATATGSSKPYDVGSWYKTTLGRDAEQSGLDYWNGRLSAEGADPNAIYTEFQRSAANNGEAVKGIGFGAANSYKGPESGNSGTPVDEWGRNVLGRDLDAAETKAWSDRFTDAAKDGGRGVEAVYNDFLNNYGTQVKKPMSWAQASQISEPASILMPAQNNPIPTGPTYLDKEKLDTRTIDRNETVAGQMKDLLAANSPFLQQARYDAMKTANERGMLNSTMAASAGEDAAIRSALNIATPDAANYSKASDYNTAMQNQASMYNADQANAFASQQQQFGNQYQLQQSQFFNQKELQMLQNGQQLTLAQLSDATERWKTMAQDATSRYNTDAQYKNTADGNKKTIVNNLLMNMDISPDRKAAMLEALGEGTMTKIVDGKVVPGSGLAGAAYIMDDVGQELSAPESWAQAVIGEAKKENGLAQYDETGTDNKTDGRVG